MNSFSTIASSTDPYRQAGVDLEQAEAVVGWAKQAAQKTMTANVLSKIGGFSGAFKIPATYKEPVMLAACDGVGTKLELAKQINQHNTIGIDLVAMNVNDLLAQGGQPLVFLDYISTGKIEAKITESILEGIAEGCIQANCALIGGETAEMPGFYPEGSYDLAGFSVGVVEASDTYPHKERMQAGDILLGLPSTGPHSNGYSLIRKILKDSDAQLSDPLFSTGKTLSEAFLAPTQIYVKPILALIEHLKTSNPEALKGMVHITGGGFQDNIPRALPKNLQALVDCTQWTLPPVFQWLAQKGNLSVEALCHTFNCGVGYMLIIQPAAQEAIQTFLQQEFGIDAFVIGKLAEKPENASSVVLNINPNWLEG